MHDWKSCFCVFFLHDDVSCLQVTDLTPQVVKAGRIVLSNPDNPAAVEHFDLLKKQWLDNMEKLRGFVDEATDTVAFIKACGKLLRQLQKDSKKSPYLCVFFSRRGRDLARHRPHGAVDQAW